MPEEDDTPVLLRKLCAIQEQQLAKLAEIASAYASSLETSAKWRERSDKQLQLYEESQKRYEDRAKIHDEQSERYYRETRIRGIIMVILWLVITVSVVVHYFF